MTNLYDEVYGVFDDDLCDLSCWLVQDDAEVVLSGGQRRFHHSERATYLGKDAVGRIGSTGVIEHLGEP